MKMATEWLYFFRKVSFYTGYYSEPYEVLYGYNLHRLEKIKKGSKLKHKRTGKIITLCEVGYRTKIIDCNGEEQIVTLQWLRNYREIKNVI